MPESVGARLYVEESTQYKRVLVIGEHGSYCIRAHNRDADRGGRRRLVSKGRGARWGRHGALRHASDISLVIVDVNVHE